MNADFEFHDDNGATLARLNSGDAMPDYHSPRTFWHPITTLHGTTVTEVCPDDHPWHWGLSLGIPNIRVDEFNADCNLWGGPTFALPDGYQDAGDNGRQVERSLQTPSNDSVNQDVEWQLADGRSFIREYRTTVLRRDTAVAALSVDLTSTWSNLTRADVIFGSPTTAGRPDAGYGGWFLRGAPLLRNASVSVDGVPTTQEDARGATGASLSLRAANVELVMAGHPDNPVAPAPWFVRTDPVVMVCAAPFFHETFTLPGGATVMWRWSLTVSDR